MDTDEKLNAVKNSSFNPPKEKISVNQCKSVSQIEGSYTLIIQEQICKNALPKTFYTDINNLSTMNPRNFTRASAMLIVLTMFLLILASAPFTITLTSAEVTELNVPSEVVQGETLSISGKASANEEVWIGSSFELSLPVSDGKYSREFNGIHFPAGEKVFSVTAENVKNIRISICCVWGQTIEFPLEGPLNATDGTATISISFPVTWEGTTIDIYGKKDVKVYGDAADDAISVNLKVATSKKVIADPNGDFALDINTEGVPLGEFLITAGGIEKIVRVVSAETPVFNTGSPENPYPSISGTHYGAIMPNKTITVHRLYTYPCSGTGGHSEYIRIENNSGWNVTARWDGYSGDWHNITFEESFTLQPGEEYNYTLITGSYPQIIHQHVANVTGGAITCTEFIDANGKIYYYDWIPAIILSYK